MNLNQQFIRGDFACQTAVAETLAVWGIPTRPAEYMTGYVSESNYSGHNPDNNGIAHAVDIFTGPGNIPLEDGVKLANYFAQLGAAGDERVYYVIHNDQIASPATGYKFSGSGYGHFDHIHISIVDLYIGDPISVPASIYDSRNSWGIIEKFGKKEDDMPITQADANLIAATLLGKGGALADAVLDRGVLRPNKKDTNTLRWHLASDQDVKEEIIRRITQDVTNALLPEIQKLVK